MSVNFCILTGRLVRDPEIRYTKKENTAVTTFSLAVDRFQNGEKSADFFKCICFKKTAELVDQYCIKGSSLLVVGEIHDNNWEKDGVKHHDKEILVKEIQFMSGKTRVANARDIEPGGEFSEIDDDAPLPF